MSQALALAWQPLCQAYIPYILRDKKYEKRYRLRGQCHRIQRRPCTHVAQIGRWCRAHAYKEEIMQAGERMEYKSILVNEYLLIGEGYQSWFAFAQVASRARCAQLEARLKAFV